MLQEFDCPWFNFDDLSSRYYYPHFEPKEPEATRKLVHLRFTLKPPELTPAFNHCSKQWHTKHIAQSKHSLLHTEPELKTNQKPVKACRQENSE